MQQLSNKECKTVSIVAMQEQWKLMVYFIFAANIDDSLSDI